jgi:phage-related protein
MIGWIKRMFDLVSGAVDETVRQWVHDLISGLYGFLHTLFGNVIKAWIYFWDATRNMRSGLAHLGEEAWVTFYHLYKVILPGIVHWATLYFKSVEASILSVYHWAIRTTQDLAHDIVVTANDIRHWVVTDIWNPIWHILTQAWDWITHEGATVWHYISHPANLVDLLWNDLIAKLETEAWNVAGKLGRFALSLVVRNLKTFVLLVEDIIDAIL